MAIAQRNEVNFPRQQGQPDLRVVETPPSPVLPLEKSQFSKGDIAKIIGGVITDIREMYQKDMGAASGIDYEIKRASKRRDMVTTIFREFHMIDEAVELEAKEKFAGLPAAKKAGRTFETPFEKVYRETERTVITGDVPRSAMIDLVEQHYDHPVLRTLVGLQRIQQTGALAEDSVTAMRASAMLLHQVEPPTPEQ